MIERVSLQCHMHNSKPSGQPLAVFLFLLAACDKIGCDSPVLARRTCGEAAQQVQRGSRLVVRSHHAERVRDACLWRELCSIYDVAPVAPQ